MRSTKSKIQNNQFPSGEGRAALQTILSKYFDSHSAEETEASLTDLLQAWTNADPGTGQTALSISNMVFFVSSLNLLVRKVTPVKCFAGHITDLTDQLGSDYIEELLNQVLQDWICPDDYSTRSVARVADAVSAFRLLAKLVSKLESVNQLQGGLLCA